MKINPKSQQIEVKNSLAKQFNMNRANNFSTIEIIISYLKAHKEAFKNAMNDFFSNFFSSLLTCLVLAIAVCLSAGFGQMISSLRYFTDDIHNSTQISLFIEKQATNIEINNIYLQVSALPEIKSSKLIMPNEALQNYKNATNMHNIVDILDENPLPATIVITANEIELAKMQDLHNKLKSLPQIENINFDLLWVEKVNRFIDVLVRFVIGLALLFFALLVLTIGNTIRLYVANKKTQMSVLNLIGATNSYIKRPFLYLGLFYGVIGGFIACVLLYFSFESLNDVISKLAILYNSGFVLQQLTMFENFYIILIASFCGFLSAFLSTLFYLNENNNN